MTIIANCIVLALEEHLPEGDKTPLAVQLVTRHFSSHALVELVLTGYDTQCAHCQRCSSIATVDGSCGLIVVMSCSTYPDANWTESGSFFVIQKTATAPQKMCFCTPFIFFHHVYSQKYLTL